jgi:acetoin utilization deacetylase AcuC-like enzyme
MDRIAYYYPEGHAVHYETGHPERPERVEVIRIALQQRGLWEGFPHLLPLQLDERVLTTVHSPAYLNLLEISCRRGGHLDADTYMTSASWELALGAAGGAAATTQVVWRGQAQRGFALTRPPGHHATRGQGMGFCLLNNVALAAESLIQKDNASRLAIVDIDLHHGNGTQDIFYQRGDVLYISTHQSPLYPGSGALEEIGLGAGLGLTANFPFPPGAGDVAFITVMDEFILPLLARYKPEMILVSYGFDAHWSDPLGHLLLSAEGYYLLIKRLVEWADLNCQGRIAVFLEGGYNLDAAAVCSYGVVAALLGLSMQDTMGSSSYPEGRLWRGMLDRAHRLWQI